MYNDPDSPSKGVNIDKDAIAFLLLLSLSVVSLTTRPPRPKFSHCQTKTSFKKIIWQIKPHFDLPNFFSKASTNTSVIVTPSSLHLEVQY